MQSFVTDAHTTLQKVGREQEDRRVEFSEILMEGMNIDPNLVYRIVFCDETIFQIDVEVNRQKCWYWYGGIPR